MAILNTHTIGTLRIIVIDDVNPYLYNLPIGSIAISAITGTQWDKKNNTANGWQVKNFDINEIVQYSDFITTATTVGENVNWSPATANGGSTSQSPFETVATTGNPTLKLRYGVFNNLVTTNAISRSGYNSNGNISINATYYQKIAFETSMRIISGNLPVAGTNEYKVRYGLMDSTAITPPNGIYFESPNNGETFWRIVCRAANVETSILTTKTYAIGTYHGLIAEWTDAGSVTFYIRDASGLTNVGTISTNIPTASIQPSFTIIKSIGSIAASMATDYYQLKITTKNREKYD
jgi:hypothetical protein